MITLVLGGARSGKSEHAERLAAARGGGVTYLAAGPPAARPGGPPDSDMAARVAAHRARRPPGWTTVEAAGAGLLTALAGASGTVVVDALGTWLAGIEGFSADADGLCRALAARPGDTVVVSEEVGMGVHPSSETGRRFRDALGLLNQRVAAVADEVVLVVAGRALALPAPPAAGR